MTGSIGTLYGVTTADVEMHELAAAFTDVVGHPPLSISVEQDLHGNECHFIHCTSEQAAEIGRRLHHHMNPRTVPASPSGYTAAIA